MADELTKLRKKIDAADEVILNALAKRMGVEKEIGAYKRKNRLPLLDASRKETLLDARVATGKTKDIEPKFVRKLFTLIHNQSLSNQKTA